MKAFQPDIHWGFSCSYVIVNFKSTMKLSWTSLKISIAGAKLSHLTQKDRIWDHGTMVEFVKIVFYQLQKIRHTGDGETLKKYLTIAGYEKLKKQMDELKNVGKIPPNIISKLKDVCIIEVMPATKKHPDFFKALIKGYEVYNPGNVNTSVETVKHDDIIHEFSEQWTFVRQGEWWLLNDCIKKGKPFFDFTPL